MRLMKFTFYAFFVCSIMTLPLVNAQVFSPQQNCVIDANGQCVPNTLLSAVPFLRITPDAIGGGMGDAGIATGVNPYAMHYNASKLAFASKNSELAATYTPWLRNLGLNDVYLAYLGGYKKIDDLQSFGYNLRFFSLGTINFRDANGNVLGDGRPREFEAGLAYARKLSDKFSASVGGKFIFSNLATGFQVNGQDINSGSAFAADVSMTYNTNPDLGTNPGNALTLGASISNLGSRISYVASSTREFIPTNLGIGAGYKMNLDDFNSFTIALDVNKLLLPTPIPLGHPDFDRNGNNIPDYKEKSNFGGVLGSFADAPGGFSEELQEIAISFGVEYWYAQQFAVRTGYFYEHPLKGDRQYITVGFGIKYNVFGFDFSYLAPTTNQRSPLDNTLRFSFTFAFGDEGAN